VNIKQVVDEATLYANSYEEISAQQVSEILNKHSFAIVRGLISSEVISKAITQLKKSYSPDNDSPATGENPSDVMDNFQKLSIGGAEHSGVYRPRCMRTFYNPIWSDDIYGLREVFRLTAQIRNVIYGKHLNYAVNSVEDGFWTAARIHHYPAGGGFLVSHIDDVVPVVQKAEGISHYFQPVIVMSKKGKGVDCDFETGGGFFEVYGERFYYETHCELGDLIIYSGATTHGVADIDLHKPFDSRKCEGRYAGFVTLYKKFERKGQLDDYVKATKTIY
jgi:hypothetical protein|tara:strand:- start:271 stop:1101 length:831 start_codon:yes stop_codon:yes gene_type:complete